MKKIMLFLLTCIVFCLFCACGELESPTPIVSDETVQKYSVGAYYSTKRDTIYIYFDESTKTAYRGSKQGSTIDTFDYSGSILDEEDGAFNISSNCVYKIEGKYIKKYSSDGRELQSYSIIGYDIEMHKNLRDK